MAGEVGLPLTPLVLAEVRQERVWRQRCGEPCRDRFPVRCRRDLEHRSPHVGLVGDESVVWLGRGNIHPVQVTGEHCWCSPESEASDV